MIFYFFGSSMMLA